MESVFVPFLVVAFVVPGAAVGVGVDAEAVVVAAEVGSGGSMVGLLQEHGERNLGWCLFRKISKFSSVQFGSQLSSQSRGDWTSQK